MPQMQPRGRPESYEIIRAAIGALDAAPAERSPEKVASQCGLDPRDMREALEQWSGLPARECLALLAPRHSATLLERCPAALNAPARPAVTFETAATERRERGAGLTIRWAVTESPFGPALTMATGKGICAIGFTDETGEEAALADLRARWPAAQYRHDDAAIAPLAAAAFRAGGAAPLHLIGAPFQLRVWEVLLRIPPGEVTTYSAIADAIGHPAANRAVGTAVGRNPVSLLVPCHRVLRRDGAMGGYHWGLMRKRAMLAWESAHHAVALAA